jgi:hypothetical protein
MTTPTSTHPRAFPIVWLASLFCGLAVSVAAVAKSPYPPHPLWPEAKAAPSVPCTTDELPLAARVRGAWTPNRR